MQNNKHTIKILDKEVLEIIQNKRIQPRKKQTVVGTVRL